MMKVCFVSYQAIRLLSGGPQTQIFETKKALEKLGASVSLYNMWEKFDFKSYDLVHIFGTGISNYHFMRELYKLGIKTVLTPIFYSTHSASFIRSVLLFDKLIFSKIRGFWIDYRLVSDMCNWADMILPNTHREAILIKNSFNVRDEKIYVVPNGVNDRFFNANSELFIKNYNLKNFILNVGHIGPGRKNLLRLMQALKHFDIPAVIIGRIESGSEYEKLRKLSSPQTLFIESISNDSELLASAYAACDVFVLPSLFETPGIAALEAALAGAKIVITKYGGTQEYFKDYAEYVDPYSVNSIVQGIKNALTKPKSEELRNFVKNNFLWDNVGKKTMDAYFELLKR